MKYHIRPLLTLAIATGIISALALSPASALQQQPLQQDLPPGHPPIELPAGHPPINDGRPAGHPTLGGGHPGGAMQQSPRYVEADPDDVTTIDQLVTAYYDTVSGEPGTERDWNRFRSLFIPEARMIAAQPAGPNQPCVVLTTEQFVKFNASYFERGGYVERDIHRVAERFGNAAHVFSTYEARRSEDDPKPYSRGINSMQLVFDGARWWIASVMWDYEREDSPIPAHYLAQQIKEQATEAGSVEVAQTAEVKDPLWREDPD